MFLNDFQPLTYKDIIYLSKIGLRHIRRDGCGKINVWAKQHCTLLYCQLFIWLQALCILENHVSHTSTGQYVEALLPISKSWNVPFSSCRFGSSFLCSYMSELVHTSPKCFVTILHIIPPSLCSIKSSAWRAYLSLFVWWARFIVVLY